MASKILNESDIEAIKVANALRRTLSNKYLAHKYGVSTSTIKNVLYDDSYKRKLRSKRKRDSVG